ncbi:hypothetical protein UY3_11169 [Chelonia mydas]|uniref:Uncharacterized protein n=1 Tax=Chelonia mydas TaxID=8469 RepID=M7B3P0_CHEMY|nr:hypothetical protein UY3_11169 [Chelonia mydas]
MSNDILHQLRIGPYIKCLSLQPYPPNLRRLTHGHNFSHTNSHTEDTGPTSYLHCGYFALLWQCNEALSVFPLKSTDFSGDAPILEQGERRIGPIIIDRRALIGAFGSGICPPVAV